LPRRSRILFESFEVDKNTGKVIITKQEELSNLKGEDINEVKKRAKLRLAEIVRQVKALKAEAEEIKSFLANL
jgi:hypothetical protein